MFVSLNYTCSNEKCGYDWSIKSIDIRKSKSFTTVDDKLVPTEDVIKRIKCRICKKRGVRFKAYIPEEVTIGHVKPKR